MEERKVITVTVSASESFPADTVVIRLNAVAKAKKYADAVKEADSLATPVVSALKNIAPVKNAGVNVSADRDGKKTIGYTAVQNYIVRFPYDGETCGKVFSVLDAGGLEYRLSYELDNKDCAVGLLEKTVATAREKAEKIAAAAGVKLGALIKAEYASGGAPVAYRVAAFGGSATLESDPKDITLSESVTCSFEIA